ncbi:MAG: Sua5 family C-terminal domain-containing protein [Luteibaculum sp.]
MDDVLSFLGDHPNKRVGVLSFKTKYQGPNLAHLIVLSKEGNLEEAAAGLYGALHELDDQELDLIVAERMPSEGLGASINDRLERATQ